MATSLLIKIKNTGAPKYRVFYRKYGTDDPYAGGTAITATAAPAEFTEYSVIGIESYRYEWYIVTICADGSESVGSQLFYSKPCLGPTGINAYKNGNNFIVQYTLPITIGRFRLRVEYPNGGSLVTNYIADQTGQVTVPIPSNVYGDYLFSISSICNIDTDFISEYTSDVLVEVPNPSICGAPTIGNAELLSFTSGEQTWRFTLGSNTSTVKVYIDNTTLNTNNTLTQAVTSGHIDVPLPRGPVQYDYFVTIYNICGVGQDNVGDSYTIGVTANV
jgi:hypothetical protein